MALSSADFFSYMEKLKSERVEEIKTLTTVLTEGVKNEVTAALQPFEEKQKNLDENQQSIVLEQSVMKEQLCAIQQQLAQLQPRRPHQPPPCLPQSSTQAVSSENEHIENSESKEISKIIAEAKKIVGFSPMPYDDLQWLKEEHSIEDDTEAMIFAIKEFLDREMKVPRHILDRLHIVKVFPPAQQLQWNRLYAEFSDIQSANLVHSYARNLKPNTSVFIWVPHQFYQRFRVIKDEEYKLRKSREEWKTKIKFGTSDLVLMKRPKNGGSWSDVNLSDLPLPPIDILAGASSSSESPPKGRSRKRTRLESSDDDDDHTSDAKSLKPDQKSPKSTSSPPKLSPEKTKPKSVVDPGSFLPSACHSPKSSAINKDYTFGSKIPFPTLTQASKSLN